jgi:hypothetical protein
MERERCVRIARDKPCGCAGQSAAVNAIEGFDDPPE